MKNVFIPFVSMGQAGDALLMGGITLAHLGPLSTKWPSFKCDSLPTHHYWPSPSLYDCLLSTDGCFQQHKHEPSVLKRPAQSHAISIREHLWFVMEHEIYLMHQISLMLSLQYGLKSLRNVPGTFMNRRHKRESNPELARRTQSNCKLRWD